MFFLRACKVKSFTSGSISYRSRSRSRIQLMFSQSPCPLCPLMYLVGGTDKVNYEDRQIKPVIIEETLDKVVHIDRSHYACISRCLNADTIIQRVGAKTNNCLHYLFILHLWWLVDKFRTKNQSLGSRGRSKVEGGGATRVSPPWDLI